MTELTPSQVAEWLDTPEGLAWEKAHHHQVNTYLVMVKEDYATGEETGIWWARMDAWCWWSRMDAWWAPHNRR